MSVDHYENFPVGSVLLPPHLRQPVAVIYRFARTADDFADEGELATAERLALLDDYRQELRHLKAGKRPETPLFVDLGQVIGGRNLPFEPFFDLLDAFSQDVVKVRYADFNQVLHYCRRSANPVGRLMLHLYGAIPGPSASSYLAWSDSICSALQLINFWQDVKIDLAKDRIYLPQDEMARHCVTEVQLNAGDCGGGYKPLMRLQIDRARSMLLSGAPLARRLPVRIGLELRMIVQGGLRILEKLERVEGDVFRHRPTLRAWDWPLMLLRSL